MKIETLQDLTIVLTKLGIKYSIKNTGHLRQYKTVTYKHNGSTRHADFYAGNKLIGLWG